MNKFLAALFIVVCVGLAHAQVGIGTTNPQTTLQVVGDPGVATIADGVMAPRLTGNELKAKDAVYGTDEIGALVYITSAVTGPTTKTANVLSVGYYYFDGAAWQKLVPGTAMENLYTTNGTVGAGRTVSVTDNLNFDNNTLYIDGTNNSVGIGTATPGLSLEVRGSSNGSNVFPGLVIGNNSTGSAGISHSSRILMGSGPGRGAYIEGIHTGSINHNHHLAFGSSPAGFAAVERMRITDDGYIGMGITTPLSRLHIKGTSGNYASSALYLESVGTNRTWSVASRPDFVGSFAIADESLGQPRLMITTAGNVGINTTTVIAKLHVNGVGGSNMSGNYGYLNNVGTGTASSVNTPASIYATGLIATGHEFRAYSDARIKVKQGTVDHMASLNTVAKLNILKYSYKDTKTKGDAIKTGVFAQEVEAVFPEAVLKGKEFIPNVYSKADVKTVGEQTVFMGINSSDIAVGDVIKFYMLENKVETEKTAQVVAIANNQLTINTKLTTKEAFVYGKEVSDFRNLDYDRLTILNLSATKGLLLQLEKQQAQNVNQQVQIENQQVQLEDQQKQLDELKGLIEKLTKK
jgi:hypothetical protein